MANHQNEEIQIEKSVTITEKPHQPRLQNRRCGVMLVKTIMPDGKSVRILQILDLAVDFSAHPEFVQALNTYREKCYGPEGAFYTTKNEPIPTENPEIVVHFAFIGTKTGKISGEKVFTKDEARAYMQKLRDEIRQYREARYNTPGAKSFGTNMADAIKAAKTPLEVVASAN